MRSPHLDAHLDHGGFLERARVGVSPKRTSDVQIRVKGVQETKNKKQNKKISVKRKLLQKNKHPGRVRGLSCSSFNPLRGSENCDLSFSFLVSEVSFFLY